MRVSLIVRKLLKHLIVRFQFARTLATATFTASAAVFSFAILPTAHAAVESAPSIPQLHQAGDQLENDLLIRKGTLMKEGSKLEADMVIAAGTTLKAGTVLEKDLVMADGTVYDANSTLEADVLLTLDWTLEVGTELKNDRYLTEDVLLKAGTQLQNGAYTRTNAAGKDVYVSMPDNLPGNGSFDLNNFDTSANVQSGEKSGVETKDLLYYVWNKDEGRYEFSRTKPTGEDSQKTITIKNQAVYGDPSKGEPTGKWKWSKVDSNITPDKGESGWKIEETTSDADLNIYGSSTKSDDPIRSNSDKLDKATNIVFSQTKGVDYKANNSGTNDSQSGNGGIGAFLKKGEHQDLIAASFIGNRLESTTSDHGGAIYVTNDASIGSITGDFISNFIKTSGKPFGGAIFNLGTIDEITGNFIGNFLHGTGKSTANGGAISNGAENLSDELKNEETKIGKISGYFIGNYVNHTSDFDVRTANSDKKEDGNSNWADTIGGAIVNYGQIGEIEGVFIGNYAESTRTANSGVIRNYQRNLSRATIGSTDYLTDDNGDGIPSTDVVFNGIFINNYAKGIVGDATGGVMRNNGTINGKIQGLYVGNYVATEGVELKGETPEVGTYNYLRKNTNNNQTAITRERTGMAYGGVFYNDIKTDMGSKWGRPVVGDIEATFIDNYASSVWGEAFGGAIVNRDSKIGTINSTFVGNHATSEHFIARGGAIYNDQSGYFTKVEVEVNGKKIEQSWVGEIQNLGDADAFKNSKTITSLFEGNYAQGKSAQGGAVYLADKAKIDNVYVYFKDNYVVSSFDGDADTDYYLHTRADAYKGTTVPGLSEGVYTPYYEAGTLTPTAQGGAIYVAAEATMKEVYAIFEGNIARTTGVGNLTFDKKTEKYGHVRGGVSANETETAQGGAIYVSRGGDDEETLNIENIYADFTDNAVENAGQTQLKNVKSIAQGGAIYVADKGRVGNIVGNLTSNKAWSHSSGSEEETAQGGALYVAGGAKVQNVGMENAYVSISNNSVKAAGDAEDVQNGGSIRMQQAQGGAIYVSKDNDLIGSIEEIYADFKDNKVIANLGAKNKGVDTRKVQGGAIYIYDGSSINNIYGAKSGFYRNSITVDGGSNDNVRPDNAENILGELSMSDLYVQGGAVYVAKDAHAANIQADFIENSATSSAVGNLKEYVGGGAIYVADHGYIDNIGYHDPTNNRIAFQTIRENKVVANGMSTNMVQQRARGGAILVSDKNDGVGHSIGNIYANFVKNTITANVDEGNHVLEERFAIGGAIYVSQGGEVGSIVGSTGTDEVGFTENTITVTGGEGLTSNELNAWGGAVYVAEEAKMGTVNAHFRDNQITTKDAYGNAKESLGGGAIYVAGGGEINDMGNGYAISITGNKLIAGGNGSALTEQTVQGGAIFVGYAEINGSPGSGTIGNICATEISNNTIEANLNTTSESLMRAAQGGAIYLAQGGHAGNIGEIFEGSDHSVYITSINKNSITVSSKKAAAASSLDLSASKESDLIAQGGAIFVSQRGYAGNITANLTNNSISSTAEGQQKEWIGGGALYVADEGYVGTIGGGKINNKESVVYASISDNSLTGAGKSSLLTEQRARGGAILLSAKGTDGTDWYSSKGIYADFEGNYIAIDADESATKLTTRTARGGAIYLSQEGIVDGSIQSSTGFIGNYIAVSGGAEVNSTTLNAQGGAMFVDESAQVDGIVVANFEDNWISTGGYTDGQRNGLKYAAAEGNKEEYVGGGALYINDGGQLNGGIYGSFIGNKLTTGGNGVALTEQKVQGGALFVAEKASIGSIGESELSIIADNISGNAIESKLGTSKIVNERKAQGGAIFIDSEGSIGGIYSSNGIDRNTITVSGGSNENERDKNLPELAELESDFVVQGGAIYVSASAHAGDIVASSIQDNSVSSSAVGNFKEFVGGGAIYVSLYGYVGSIGKIDNEGNVTQINNNSITAEGKSILMKDQRTRGGAILLSAKGTDGYSTKDIYADFVGNNINSKALTADDLNGKTAALDTRYALGGAIYLSDEAVIAGDIVGGVNGFKDNRINVSGGNVEASIALTAEGGALYVSRDSSVGNVISHFTGNEIDTTKAFGNKTETLAGGAVYVAGGAVVGDIGYYDKVENKGRFVDITDNKLMAGGQGDNLQEQTAQGGAIFVGSTSLNNDSGIQYGKLGTIYASSISNNSIMATQGNSTSVDKRYVQGGAIYVANEAKVGDIWAIGDGFKGNSIIAVGGSNDNIRPSVTPTEPASAQSELEESGLLVQGGAIYVSANGEIGNVYASFTENKAESNTLGNQKEFVGGGAIYVADSSTMGSLGSGSADDHYAWAKVSENSIVAHGQSTNMQYQRARGGAILVSKQSKMGNIFADITDNMIDAWAVDKDSNSKLTNRLLLGGAVFLADNAKILADDGKTAGIIQQTEKGFDGNKIKVAGGYSEKTIELEAKGGAFYLSSGGEVGAIYANFTNNEINTYAANGNAKEILAGGALYVAGGAKVGSIGAEDYGMQINGNHLKAGGNGSMLSNQVVQGGAIYVGSENQKSGAIGAIYADIMDNSIEAKAGTGALGERLVQGGAVFLSERGSIQEIHPSDDLWGFRRDTIKVTGGNEKNETNLTAQGGALYASHGAGADGIMAGFADNGIDTTKAIGNKTETLAGGAIYLAKGAWILGIGKEDTRVEITKNYLKAGGNGSMLEKQMVQGGALYVSVVDGEEAIAVDIVDTVGNIWADITDNTIEAYAGKDSKIGTREIQGGAIYVAGQGKVGDIHAGDNGKGISENKITVSGGTAGSGTTLAAQGGAIYLADDGQIGFIRTNFCDNEVTVKETEGNSDVKAQGGAIYVAAGGEIQNIGAEDKKLTISGNKLFIGANAVDAGTTQKDDQGNEVINRTQKEVMGGAIFVNSGKTLSGDIKAGKISDIYADFSHNSITSEGGKNNLVETRVYGGAIFVYEYSEIGNITGDFEFNSATSGNQPGAGSLELAHGGAIDVSEHGSIQGIQGEFRGNIVKNSNAESHEKDGSDKHAKGGAIYLADNGNIGKVDSYFEANQALGSGQVRGGAFFVSEALVEDIQGDFVENKAIGLTKTLTYGGAVRFDGSTIYRLDSSFIRNTSNGYGGALSLTDSGLIYEVRGDFKGNQADLKGAGVEDLGDIGLRGHVVLKDGDDILDGGVMKDDYSNVEGYGEGKLKVVRDATDRENFDGNLQGRWEFDGSFTGGFINSSFFYNTIETPERGYGAGIYTDKDLFITVMGYKETIMSGNHVRYALEGKELDKGHDRIIRSAIYVDNENYKTDQEDEASTIVVYMVAKDNGILRIDDNIRGYDGVKKDAAGNTIANEGFTLRLRGYTTNTANKHDDTGLIILNNRVEQSYSIMDDVTLYIGYRVHTYQDKDYIEEYASKTDLHGEDVSDKHIKDGKYVVGDEVDENGVANDIIRLGKDGSPDKSLYLNGAGTTRKDGKEVERAGLFHQSDVFRDSHLSVRSGTVALTENTYGNKIDADNNLYLNPTEMSGADERTEAYTEYLFGSLIAYGTDYNYGIYGTAVDNVKEQYTGSSFVKYEKDGHVYYQGDGGLYAKFEFGISFNGADLYELELANKIYYADENGNATEERYWYDTKGERHERPAYLADGKEEVHVKRQMAKSDMLTVFAVANKGADGKLTLDWSQTSKGRVTLNGLTVQNAIDGWQYTNKSVSGSQPQEGLENGDGFNRDLYIQLINYNLVDADRKPITNDPKLLEQFYAMFDEEENGSLEGGYHLLRLSDHFDLVTEAKAYMKGSDVMADEIELATTVTKDDSIRVVNWRDHLAEWAEHKGTWDEESTEPLRDSHGDIVRDENGEVVLTKKESGELSGKKHFLLDQSVYYLNRNINLVPNPTEEHHEATGDQMWGQYLTIEGKKRANVLDLQHMNMLSHIIDDQQVRLQSFSLNHVLNNHMQNDGDLIFDTMVSIDKGLVVNNAANEMKENYTLNNQMTVTGIMYIDFTITTEAAAARRREFANAIYGEKISYNETEKHGTLYINHTTQVQKTAMGQTESGAKSAPMDNLLDASVINITGTVEHQNITHQGDDEMKLASENKDYKDSVDGDEGEKQTLGTWHIETGLVDLNTGVRESFTTNTYLNTTEEDANKQLTKATAQFRAFQDNSLIMEGGAFNLGTMYKHRLKLRDFAVNGGGVFVDHSTIDLNEEVMGGIDTLVSATYKGDTNPAAKATGTGDGLIWLQEFAINDTSEKEIVHVKFVDDGVGNAVKDGMGIANGAKKSGMRIMADGKNKYLWEVTYNDKEAENTVENPGWVGIKGMYTFRRRGFTPEAQAGPVTDLTGSYVSMMQVYNYSFQHADMFADSVFDAQRESLYERNYTAITQGGKNAAPGASRPCSDKAAIKNGLWLNTYSSTEDMPLHNGPKVRMNMYGGFIGADSNLNYHSNGWASVWSFYGGYMGSTQHYEGVRIRQNGAAIGGTGTFYHKDFFAAFTASVGASQATTTGSKGNEDSDLMMGGIAARTGYNIRLDGGRYMLQPTLQLSYTMFNTFDYTNSVGAKIDSKPTGVFQVNPALKLIRKTDCAWKPYASVGMVYNAFGNTHYRIDGTELPSMSIDPYVEYSIGVQHKLNESYIIYGQATGRNGGRNGVEFNAGIRCSW